MCAEDLAGHRESEPTASGAGRGEEGESGFGVVDPGSRVAELDLDRLRPGARGDGQTSAVGHRVEGVAKKVVEDLGDPRHVDEEGNGLGGEIELEGNLCGAERELVEAEHALEEVVEMDASATKLSLLSEAEIVLQEIVQAEGLSFQRLEPTIEVAS